MSPPASKRAEGKPGVTRWFILSLRRYRGADIAARCPYPKAY